MKVKERLSIIIILLIVSITINGCGDRNRENLSRYKSIISARVIEGENIWEVHKSFKEQAVLTVLNGNIQSKMNFSVKENEAEIMKLPNLENIKGKDITSNKPYSGLIWEASLNESAKQIKYLKDKGFEIKMKAETQRFIEIYMENKSGKFKRILITSDKISLADVDRFIFNSINEYVF